MDIDHSQDVEMKNLEDLEAEKRLVEEDRKKDLASWQRIERNAHDWRVWAKGLTNARKDDPSWDAQGKQLRGRGFGGVNPLPNDTRVDPAPRKCFCCWERSQKQNRCPYKIKDIVCYNCGRRDQDISTCPRCKDAHQEKKLREEALQSLPRHSTTEQLYPHRRNSNESSITNQSTSTRTTRTHVTESS